MLVAVYFGMEQDAPFVAHVGPRVQFGGAFCGHVPPRSLDVAA